MMRSAGTPSRGTTLPWAPLCAARRAACAGLALASLALGGCGFSVLGHRIGPRPAEAPPSAAEPAPAPPPSPLEEARAEAALDPGQAYWHYRIGQLLAAADSIPEAEAALGAALERDPYHAPALSLLSKLQFEHGRHDQAIARLEAARANPEAFGGRFPAVLSAGLALHYDAVDRTDLARGVIAGMREREVEEAGSALVYVTLRGDHPDSATVLARAALEEDGKSAANQNNYGITRLRAGDPDQARRAFLAAIELDPELPGPYYNLAILEKFYLFDDAAAARWLDAYWDRSRDDPDSLRHSIATLTGKDGDR